TAPPPSRRSAQAKRRRVYCTLRAGDKPALDRCRVAASPDPAYCIRAFPSVRASEAPPGLLHTPGGR
ncbi:hypothetical protein ACQYIO_002924, partial [Raoultella ornithinolytica]